MGCTGNGEAITLETRTPPALPGSRRWRDAFPLVATSLVAAMTLTSMTAFGARGAVVSVDALPGASHLQWLGSRESRPLNDGSTLSEYVVRTRAPGAPDVSLSVRFVPRFECSPLIGFRIAGAEADALAATLVDGTPATFSVDGAAGTELLLLVDDVDGSADGMAVWTDETAESRMRLRRLIDSGSRAELALPGERTFAFSLLGSRRSSAAAESACRGNEPAGDDAEG